MQQRQSSVCYILWRKSFTIYCHWTQCLSLLTIWWKLYVYGHWKCTFNLKLCNLKSKRCVWGTSNTDFKTKRIMKCTSELYMERNPLVLMSNCKWKSSNRKAFYGLMKLFFLYEKVHLHRHLLSCFLSATLWNQLDDGTSNCTLKVHRECKCTSSSSDFLLLCIKWATSRWNNCSWQCPI